MNIIDTVQNHLDQFVVIVEEYREYCGFSPGPEYTRNFFATLHSQKKKVRNPDSSPFEMIGAIMNNCLLLVDLQNDYFPEGKMELNGIVEAAQNAALLLQFFREHSLPIIHIQHISSQPNAAFFLPETNGVEINTLVAPQEKEMVLKKHYPNSFRDTDLLTTLQNQQVTSLTICGAMSHMCIDATVRAAFDFGLSCKVAADGCATRDLEFQNTFVKSIDVHASFMAALGAVYAEVLKTEKVLEQLTDHMMI